MEKLEKEAKNNLSQKNQRGESFSQAKILNEPDRVSKLEEKQKSQETKKKKPELLKSITTPIPESEDEEWMPNSQKQFKKMYFFNFLTNLIK